jgi:hypothetical protein
VRSGRSLARAGAAVAATAFLVALLPGCSGGGGGNDNSDETIDQQLGLEGDAIYTRQRRAEDFVAECMKRQGWDYTPIDPVQQRAELVGSRNLSEEDFNQQFGYGITTLFEKRLSQSALGPANQATYDALSDQNKVLYDRALYGDDKTATFADALDTGDFSRLGGCLKEATDKVFGGANVIQDVTSKLDELDNEILQDARMVKAVQDWSDCMAKKGYDFGAQDDVDAFLENRLEAIVGPVEEAKAPEPGQPPEWDEKALDQLKRDEVALVKDDIACEDKYIAKTEEKVRAEYERSFREKNAALLNQVRAA